MTDPGVPLEDVMAPAAGDAEALIDPASYGRRLRRPRGDAGQVIDLTPGRWVYACIVPAGTTDATPGGTGPPDADAGMCGDVTVR